MSCFNSVRSGYHKVTLFCFPSLFFLITSWAEAQVIGFDLQNFNPATNGLGFLTVHSGHTLEPGQVHTGFFLDYGVNSLPWSNFIVNNRPSYSVVNPQDQILYAQISGFVGITDFWEVGISGGFTLLQTGEDSNFLFYFKDKGINDFSLFSKFNIYKNSLTILSLLLTASFNQVDQNPFVGNKSNPSFQIVGVGEIFLTPRLSWAFNGGYELRQMGVTVSNSGVIPLYSQWVYSTAFSLSLGPQGSALIYEVYGSYPVRTFSFPTDRRLDRLEQILAYRYKFRKDLNLVGGLGNDFFGYRGLGSPQLRVFLGFEWGMKGGKDLSINYLPSKP